jgi:hypothetical protein
MKASKIFLFILSVILILGVVWVVFPQGGIKVGGTTLRFASYEEASSSINEEVVDVDKVLSELEQSLNILPGSHQDSLRFFKNFLKSNPNRIWLPNDDYTYLDSLFHLFENAKKEDKTYRIMHYGDSQIEMDRISSIVREHLQGIFGGNGNGLVPAIQSVSTYSLVQSASGALTRFTLIGDSTTVRADHNRYGVMTHFSQLYGEASISFRVSKNSNCQERAKKFSKVALLVGNTSPGFKASLRCDTIRTESKVLKNSVQGVSLLTWELPAYASRGTITLSGSAEIYGFLMDGEGGIALDNAPLRGCSGTIFTRLNKSVMKQSFGLLDTRMIILQFGGNRAVSIRNEKQISNHLRQLEKQIDYFHEVAPEAQILFIGPSDMGRSVDGRISTIPMLPDLNDSLKVMALNKGAAYWDLFNMMGGENSMVRWVKHSPPFASSDYIHFTTRGAEHVGMAFARAFEVCYNFYKLRQELDPEMVSAYMNSEDPFEVSSVEMMESNNDKTSVVE